MIDNREIELPNLILMVGGRDKDIAITISKKDGPEEGKVRVGPIQ